MILLDSGASTPLRPEVRAAMEPWLGEDGGNPSSLHAAGRRARKAVEDAREKVAAALGVADPREIVFTSGATESNALAILGVPAPERILTTAVEHPSVLESVSRRRVPFDRAAPQADGRVTSVPPGAGFASLQAVNHETGALHPLAELRRSIPEAILHVDAAQAAGKIPLSLEGVDLLTFSAHKIHGPRGAGGLWIRRGLILEPLLAGGRQEFGVRAGTENVAGIVGLAEALSLAVRELPEAGPRMAMFRDRLDQVLLRLPGARRNGPERERAPHLCNVAFEGVDGETLVHALDVEGLCVSSGSACASGSSEPSPVLLAMGQTAARAREGIRFGVSALTTSADVESALEIVERTVARLRSVPADPS
jgi:cysteine desulfurase